MNKDIKAGFKVDIQPRDREGNLLLDRQTELDIKNYKILKKKNVYDEKNLGRPKGVLDFTEKCLMAKNIQMIDMMYDDGFQVGGVDYPGSVIVFNDQVLLWDIFNAWEIRPHSFDLLEFIKPTVGNFFLFFLKNFRLYYYWDWKREWDVRRVNV